MFGQSTNFKQINIRDVSLFEEITQTTEEDIIEKLDLVLKLYQYFEEEINDSIYVEIGKKSEIH